MGEGKHARFTIRSAGVQARAVAFGVGDTLGEAAGPRPHDVAARLEVNEWAGAVEPRLVVRAVHELAQEDQPAQGCAACACRATGDQWWDAMFEELEAPLEPPPAAPQGDARPDAARTVLDRRGEGVLGTLSELLSTGEPVLVACADMSRRRSLFACELAPARFGRAALIPVSARCARDARTEVAGFGGALCAADYASLERDPGLAARFRHVFALDPPPFAHVSRLLETSVGEGYLHLGWGPAEVDFARRVLEHELALRPALASLYRVLSAAGGELCDGALEAVLAGDAAHPRSPFHAARCLRVLSELGLVSMDRSSATVRCTITSNERVELERSSAYRAYARRCEEGLRFLSETQPMAAQPTAGRAAPPTASNRPRQAAA
jgi:single-stranded-DNA-specific exonuclease